MGRFLQFPVTSNPTITTALGNNKSKTTTIKLHSVFTNDRRSLYLVKGYDTLSNQQRKREVKNDYAKKGFDKQNEWSGDDDE